MASAPIAAEPRQLWLDVDRPIQVRPRRAPMQRVKAAPLAAPQMELQMIVTPPVPFAPILPRVTAPAPEAREFSAEVGTLSPLAAGKRPSFSAWLVDQVKRPGTLGELAKAAKLDGLFPRAGTADAVRARFSAAGAEGDAFEALDDAEREYDRQIAAGEIAK